MPAKVWFIQRDAASNGACTTDRKEPIMPKSDKSDSSQLVNQGCDFLWGAAEIAEAINRTPRQAHYLLSNGQICAQKKGGRWVASRTALLRELGA
jgi:hypothetical protein